VYVEVYDKEKIHKDLFKISKDLKTFSEDNSSFLLSLDSTIENKVQKFIYSKYDNRSYEKIIKPLIIDAIVLAEMKSAGAGEICLNLSTSFLQEIMSSSKKENIIETNNKIKLAKSSLISEMKGSRKIFHKSDMNKLIIDSFKNSNQRKIAKEIIKNSNMLSPIFLEKSEKRDTVLHFENGFSFNIKVDERHLPDSGVWKYKNPRCLVIDGMIESVSEIHHLLEEASENKEPYVLFVRNISEEVRTTILLNCKRGTINVLPVEVGFDENTLNILNDMSICCNSRLVSSLTGDLISTAVKNDQVIVDKISITKNSIVISNNIKKDVLNSHLKYLVGKKDSSKSPELRDIYSKRIRSLSSGKIVLKIGKDILKEDPGVIERFDLFFRKIRSLVSHGVLLKNKSNMKNILKYTSGSCIPYLSVAIAIQNAFSFLYSISSIEKAILENKV